MTKPGIIEGLKKKKSSKSKHHARCLEISLKIGGEGRSPLPVTSELSAPKHLYFERGLERENSERNFSTAKRAE